MATCRRIACPAPATHRLVIQYASGARSEEDCCEPCANRSYRWALEDSGFVAISASVTPLVRSKEAA